jgi:hypothetical protein
MHTHTCKNYSRVYRNGNLCVKLHFVCENRIMHVEIHLVRVLITLVHVVITFLPGKITLQVEITLYLQKSHSACENCTLCNNSHSSVLLLPL